MKAGITFWSFAVFERLLSGGKCVIFTASLSTNQAWMLKLHAKKHESFCVCRHAVSEILQKWNTPLSYILHYLVYFHLIFTLCRIVRAHPVQKMKRRYILFYTLKIVIFVFPQVCLDLKESDISIFFSLRLFQDVDVDSQAFTMTGLKKNTEYSFRVVANNKHGPGVSTEDVVVRTLSDGQLVDEVKIYRHYCLVQWFMNTDNTILLTFISLEHNMDPFLLVVYRIIVKDWSVLLYDVPTFMLTSQYVFKILDGCNVESSTVLMYVYCVSCCYWTPEFCSGSTKCLSIYLIG